MNSGSERIPILIQGATGKLGSLITKHALQNPKLQVNILVRDPSKIQELSSQVENAGGRVIKGDLSDKSSLKDVTKGMHTVICTVGGSGSEAKVDGQIALIEDCIKNGVKRFVPSDYTMDYTRFTREELLSSPAAVLKVKVEDYLKTVDIPTLKFYIGDFTEIIFLILKSQGNGYWGDEDLKQDLTSYEDTAKLVVSAVARPELTGRIQYKSYSYTCKEVVDIYNKVRGINTELKRNGSLEDLKNMVEAKKDELSPMMDMFLRMLIIVFDPRSKFLETNNKNFSEIKVPSLEDFLKQSPDVML